MKKLKKAACTLLLFLTIFMFSGCVNATYTLTLNNNGNLDVDYKILYNMSADKDIVASFTDTVKRSFSDIGYDIKDTTELGMNGFVIKKNGIPPVGDGFADKLPYNVDLLDDIMYNMEFDEEARCNTYDLEGTVDLTSFATIPEAIGQKLTQTEYTKILSDMHLKLVITLEDGEIIKTNSTKVSADKKAAEWILIPGNTNPVEMEAVMGVNRGWKVSMVVVAVILVIMALFAVTLMKMYKKRNEDA